MKEGYMISDAAKMVEVENHVLRYWEEELGLMIPRNEKKQRYYRPSDIKLLRTVKDLKEQGFQLKAIKMILPDIGKIEHMDPQGVYRLREELNRQVQQEELDQQASVTSISQVRADHERRRTWQEKSYELELQKQNQSPIYLSDKRPEAASARDVEEERAAERLRQFENMLRQMIRGTIEEMSHESEERICQEVSTRLQKEMNYLLRQKEEIQEKQITLLEQILQEIKGDVPQVAATSEDDRKGGKKKEDTSANSPMKKTKRKERGKRKKLFAKLI